MCDQQHLHWNKHDYSEEDNGGILISYFKWAKLLYTNDLHLMCSVSMECFDPWLIFLFVFS